MTTDIRRCQMVCAQWDRFGRLRQGDPDNPRHYYTRREWVETYTVLNPNEETWLSDEVNSESLLVDVPVRVEVETVRCRIF